MTYKVLEVRPLAGALGAETYGADLRNEGASAMWTEIHRAFLEHHVIAIRGQDLLPANIMAVGKRFGEPLEFPFARHMEGFPYIQEVISTRTAYDALSDGMKKLLDPLVGVNNSEQKRKRSGSRAAHYAAGIGG